MVKFVKSKSMKIDVLENQEKFLSNQEKIKNSPDNSYEVKLVALKELDNIMIYGIGIDMIKKAYKRYKV